MDDEQVNQLDDALSRIANAITPLSAAPGHDETGGTVASLTEALMGHTVGLMRIAEALTSVSLSISEIAEEMREQRA